MSENVHAIINHDCCNTCVHNAVCSYKQDWLDICNALSKCECAKQLDGLRTRYMKVTLYEILDEIVIKCKHYNVVSPSYVTNPYDIPTSSSATSVTYSVGGSYTAKNL